ncbi:MAG TPA: enoyl-CoA hydratase-related protein [Bacteroidota bacterium]|nr:enoyl-CoA hydratase-related protein [Bacteroidota bacterium]
MAAEELIITRGEGYALLRLNRPEALNAITVGLMERLVTALEELDRDPAVRCVVITGSEKAFAAGADIREMADSSAVEMIQRDQFARWDRIRKIKNPIIAAVSGFALGGGCELAMSCDIIIASESAKFGQPEVNLGVIPGAGGTQRLTRAVGKYKSMEMILTGGTLSAEEAKQWGLVVRVVPNDKLLDEATALAGLIASKPPLAVRLAKEAVLKSFDTTMEGGLDFERKSFYALFASDDQKEGMKAFAEKRKPTWKGS